MRGLWILLMISTCYSNSIETQAKTKRLLPKDARAKVKARIGFECTSRAAFAKAKLNTPLTKLIRQSKRSNGFRAETALSYDLNGDSIAEYLVPMNCSPNGNCDWEVFAVRPGRYLGRIYGQTIYPRKLVIGALPAISSCIHLSVSECLLATFCFRNGRYRRCSEYFEVSPFIKNEPAWLRATGSVCDLSKPPYPFEK
jgi:hypothetical protein